MQSKTRCAIVAVSLALGASSFAFADAPTFSGFLEAGYNYNFNNPNSASNRDRSFDPQGNTFLLNDFQLQAQGKTADGNSGYTAKALFGHDATVINAATNGSAGTSDVAIEEGYIWYKAPLGSGLTLTAGRFVTTEGIEVIEGNQDYTVSRGLLFGLAEPLTHTGVKADYQFTKVLDLMLGVVNGWDANIDNNTGKTVIGRLGVNLGDPFSGGISTIYGPEKAGFGGATVNTDDARWSLDATFSTVFNKWVTLAYQANYGEEDQASTYAESHNGTPAPAGSTYATWFGFGIQPKITVTDKFWIGARYEYFEDKDGARLSANGVTVPKAATCSVQDITIAPAWNLTSALVFQTEFRYDWSNQTIFDQRNSAGAVPAGYTAANQATVGAKFNYTF